MKTKLKRIPGTFLVSFLLAFMLLIFGPSEIFFANVTEFKFVYGEFAGYLTGVAFLGAVLLTFLLILLPNILYRSLLSIIFGISLAGYLQVMFLNQKLDLLGLNPEGYQVPIGQAIGNLIAWILIIVLVVVISLWKKEIGEKIVVYGAAFLLCIQVIALGSLLISAKEGAYKHLEAEGGWYLSGENQYTVSADKNVIVIILDYFSNQYVEPMEAVYPGATEFLHDFTYYNNVNCDYYGTYPSLSRILTGNELDMSCSVNEWLEQSWNSEKTESFFEVLRNNQYMANYYVIEGSILRGTNDAGLLNGKMSNLVNSAQEIEVCYELLHHTMGKMSAYRMFPEILKPYFYTRMDEYAGAVATKQNGFYYYNYDFYKGLQENGLKTDSSSNYYIIQHLEGSHEYTTDAYGAFKEDAVREETTKGCMVIVEEYLNQLKALGVYDDATIIITSDHGHSIDSQVIFYMKQAGEKHDKSPVTNAPISLQELVPTVVEAIGEDYTQFGKSVHDFSENEQRERTVWVRKYDENYPEVPCYTGDKMGSANVYYGYTYTGDINDLLYQIETAGPSQIVPMVDSYF